MKNHFLARFDADNLRKTIIYFAIALPLIIISLVFGIEKNDWRLLCFIRNSLLFLCTVASLGKCKILWNYVYHNHHTCYTLSEYWDWYSDKDAIKQFGKSNWRAYCICWYCRSYCRNYRHIPFQKIGLII